MNQKTQQEGYRNFNLEEEERFIKKLVDAEVASKPILARGELLDFKDRGQRRKLQLYIIARDYKEMAKMREWAKMRELACRSGLGNPFLIPHHRDRYPGSRDSYIK